MFFTAALIPEPDNKFDANAIKVHLHGPHVGYFSADDAGAYSSVSAALRERYAIGLCRAKLIGGTPGKPSIGVVLDLVDATATLAALLPLEEQPF